MRTLALALFLAAAGSALAAENDSGGVGLFSRADDSPVVVTPGVWFTQGFSQTKTELSDTGKVQQEANLLATADLEMRVPGHPWLALWGRGAYTVANSKVNSDAAKDIDSTFTMAERM